MKRLKTIILILFVSLSMFSWLTFSVPSVDAVEVVIDTVNHSTTDNTDPSWSRKSFNGYGRSWVFICMYRNYKGQSKHITTWSSSTDETTWINSWDDLGEDALMIGWGDSWRYDVHYDGTYVHFAWYLDNNIYYLRGTPFSNGTIIWGTQYVAVSDARPYHDPRFPKLGVDTDGYVWIGWSLIYYYAPAFNITHFVTKSSTNDGTWSTASGFPYQLTPEIVGVGFFRGFTIPLCLGMGGATENDDTYVLYGNQLTDDIKGRLWNGAWGSEETITTDLHGYDSPAISAIAGYSTVCVAWKNTTKYLLFRERNYVTLWQDKELIADATSEEIYNGSAVSAVPVIGIDGDLTIHAFWIGIRDYTTGLGYKNRTVTPSVQWNDFEILKTSTGGYREWIECREKALGGVMACIYKDSAAPITVNQWTLDWQVTDWWDYDPPDVTPAFYGYIVVDGFHDTSGLEFKVGDETFIDGQLKNIVIGIYVLNATCYYEGLGTYHFCTWSISPTNTIENYTDPSTNVTIVMSGTIILTLETGGWRIDTYIRVNGYEPYTNMTFTIDGDSYANGQYVVLWSGNYSINGTPVTHLSFINWTAVGGVSVENTTDPTTTLTVTGNPSSLTLHFNATVKIEHNETIVTNFSADDWLFAEHKYYDFQSTYFLTNSYIDTAMWSFVDYPGNNITFYFTNSTSEGVFDISKPYAITGNNATYSYSWINLTDQTFTVTISLWPKYKIIDTLYVDLYVFGNCSGYGMTNSTDLWVTAQTDYMNLYSQGGAEEMTTSGQAGRLVGGDYFNLYAYNNSYAKSEIYWRNLVHVKILLELGWVFDYPDYPKPMWRFGFDYYARGAWVNGFQFYCQLEGFAYGADWQYAHFSAAILEGSTPDLIWSGDIYTFFDEDRGGSKVWIDLWFNKVNASSVWGMRLTSYYYAVQNNADWVKRTFTGNDWGVYYANMSEIVIFGELQDTGGTKMFSSEISLVKAWHKLSQGIEAYNNTGSTDNIQQFDYTFSIDMQGIPTPSFEAPRTPAMPMGGFLGVLASWLSALMNALSPAFAMVWTGIVWMLDEAIGWVTQGAVTNGFSSFVTMIVATSTSVLSFMTDLALGFVDFATAIGYTVSWFFTNLFSSIWGIFNFLLLTPSFNVFGAFATIVGVSLAWLGGTTYTNAWGQVYDFSYLSSMTITGTGFSGGIVVFYLIFVCGFFIQILACVGTMSIEPIAQPIRLFWGVIMFMITVIEILWNITTGFISLLVQIVQALRDISPRPLGL